MSQALRIASPFLLLFKLLRSVKGASMSKMQKK